MMRKVLAPIAALMLLLTSLPVTASASGIKVLFENQEITFPDAQPFKSQSDVMIPIRPVAEVLKLKVTFDKPSKQVHLSTSTADVAFTIASDQATINGTAVVPFGTPALSKQNRVFVPLSFFKQVLRLAAEFHADRNEAVISVTISDSAVLPQSLTEEEIVLNEGTPFALKGTLTMPKNAAGTLPAVVLVQGSGASDRNESVGALKPFRDIAWGLAQQGVAVVRYDKRTWVYGRSFTPEMIASFSVKEETVDDAIAAAKLLKNDKRIDPSRVYVAGHSLGGMLAPRIDADGGDVAGLIIMAGSARELWEIVYDQNQDVLKKMDDKDPAKKPSEALVAAELAKAQNIKNMTDAEAKAAVIFGIPAYYLKEMGSHSAKDIAVKLRKPVLIMQGDEDFQVNKEKDYPLWQELLKDNPKAAFKLYPGLNHAFVHYEGPDKGTIQEYSHPGNVDPQVVRDMAEWILKQ